MTEVSEPSDSRDGRAGEAAFLAVLLATCITGFYATFDFRVVPWDSLGLAFWPRAVLIGLAACAIWRLARLAMRADARSGAGRARGEFAKGCVAWVICTAYVLLLLVLGFAVASLLYLVVFGALISERRDLRALATSALVAPVVIVATLLVFEAFLGFDLPDGLLFG